jgi:hypothetical protein
MMTPTTESTRKRSLFSYATVSSRVLVVTVFAALWMGCAMKHRSIPATNPMQGKVGGELRLPGGDKQFQKDCAKVQDWYCLDAFFRIEAADETSVVVRYRITATDVENSHADEKFVRAMALVTADGRKIRGKLSTRFESKELPDISYSDRGYVNTGRIEHIPQADGRVITQNETTIAEVTRTLARVIGSNYIVFEGANLLSADAPKIILAFDGGLLGGGEQWTFDFTGAPPSNAVLAVGEP